MEIEQRALTVRIRESPPVGLDLVVRRAAVAQVEIAVIDEQDPGRVPRCLEVGMNDQEGNALVGRQPPVIHRPHVEEMRPRIELAGLERRPGEPEVQSLEFGRVVQREGVPHDLSAVGLRARRPGEAHRFSLEDLELLSRVVFRPDRGSEAPVQDAAARGEDGTRVPVGHGEVADVPYEDQVLLRRPRDIHGPHGVYVLPGSHIAEPVLEPANPLPFPIAEVQDVRTTRPRPGAGQCIPHRSADHGDIFVLVELRSIVEPRLDVRSDPDQEVLKGIDRRPSARLPTVGVDAFPLVRKIRTDHRIERSGAAQDSRVGRQGLCRECTRRGREVPFPGIVLGRNLEHVNLQLLDRVDLEQERGVLGDRGTPLIDREQGVVVHGEVKPNHLSVVVVPVPVEVDPECGRIVFDRGIRQLGLGRELLRPGGWSGRLGAACDQHEDPESDQSGPGAANVQWTLHSSHSFTFGV